MAIRNGRPDPAIYERAAEIIETYGLHKGDFCEKTTGRVCALGAIYAAIGERKRIKNVFDRYGNPNYDALGRLSIPDEVLARTGFSKTYDGERMTDVEFIPDWNDKPSRRKGQVAAKLREMAEVERSLR